MVGCRWRADRCGSTARPCKAGDGAAVSAAGALKLEGDDDAELLLFDMAL